jgi:glycosyltransferase involved in cell wall biosynthesis
MSAPARALIAVDADPAARAAPTGTERYAAELCQRLPRVAPDLDFVFYARRPGVRSVDLTVLPAPRLWSQARLPVELWRRRPDVLFVPAHVVPFAAPGRATTVVHDLAFERHPSAYRPAELAYLRLTTRWAERRCRTLLTVSEATRRDLAELHGVPPERVRVAHPGLPPAPPPPPPQDTARRLRRLGVDRPFVLHVGRIEPKKNQLTALAATERLPGDTTLVTAGAARDPDLTARLRRSPRCRVLGRVDAADLEALYAKAEALCFPSLYEGFGFPVLEALQRGLPVATAATSSLPEVGGRLAEYAKRSLDADDLAAALRRAMARRAEIQTEGPRWAARFGWDACAEAVAGVLRDLAVTPPR